MSQYITLERWPVALVTWRPGFVDQDVTEVIAELTACAHRGTPFGIVADFTQIPPMSKEQHAQFAAFTENNRELLRKDLRGLAFAMNSPLVRLAINGWCLVARTPAPVRAFGTPAEACKWIESQLAIKVARSA
jgi:hypothetical protein